jgi:hypothetical protein
LEKTTIYLPQGGTLEVEHTQQFINRVCEWANKPEDEVLLRDIKDYIYESFKIALDNGSLEKVE